MADTQHNTADAHHAHHQHSAAEERRHVNAATFLVAVCTMVSRLGGFLRTAVISSFFGATSAADILNLALSIPSNFRKLFAEGALSTAFMPVFAQSLRAGKSGAEASDESRQFFAGLLFWIGIPMSLLIGLGSIFAQRIVRLFFYFETDAQASLAGSIFSIAVFFLLFMMLSAIAAGVQQTHKKFLVSSAAPLMLSFVVIICVLILAPLMGIYSAAIGYVAGGFAQTAVLFFSLRPLGYSIRLSPRLTKAIKTTFAHMLSIVPALAIPIAGQQVAFYLASTLSEGSSSVFSYAIVFWQLPTGVVFNSIISVGFSYIITSRAAADKNGALSPAMISYQNNSVRMLFIFAVPIGIGMFFFAHAGIAVALQRGKFDARDAYDTAVVLQGYAAGMVPIALYQCATRFLYAQQRAIEAFVFTLIFNAIDVALSIWLVRTSLGVSGLAYAYSISCLAIVPFMFVRLYRGAGGAPLARETGRKIAQAAALLARIAAANAPFAVVAYGLAYASRTVWYRGSTAATAGLIALFALILGAVCIIGYKGVGISVIAMLRSYKKR